jgi:hypothetical protein
MRPSSGVLKTVTVTSGIGHDIGVAASFQRGLISLIPEVAVTVFSTPDDGRIDARNM